MTGLIKRIQQIPNPLSSFLLGWKESNATETDEAENFSPPPLPTVHPNVTSYSHYKSEGLTISTTVVVPTADGGQRNVGKHTHHQKEIIIKGYLIHLNELICRFVRRKHPRSAVQRSQHFDRGNVQVDTIPVRALDSAHLFMECQGK